MATTKKYVSLEKLGLYDEKIKKYLSDADAVVLQSAKDYSDSKDSQFEAAGTVSTAQAALQKNIDAVQANVDTAQAAADKAQGEIDALEILVGTLPEGSAATSVVDYVNVKTAGIATDAALGELNNQVSGLQTVVNGITADYLKSADKTELSDAIAAEKARAEGIESGLRTDVDVIKGDYLKGSDKEELQGGIDAVVEDVAEIAGDYLKAADKTELQEKIDAKVAQADYDAKMEEIDGDIDGLQTQINTIMNNPDAEGAINSINEFTQYVADHGTIADGFRADIDQNKEDIAAMDTAYKAADTLLSGRLDVLEAVDHEAYVAADAALKSELEGKIALKADASAVEAQGEEIAALQEADAGIIERVAAVEAQLGDGEGSVADLVADAKQEAIDAAAADATAKADAAESAAKSHADSLNTAMDARVGVVEAKAHEHANKALLDTYTQTEANLADAVAKKHEHSNLSVLETLTAAKIAAWDAAEQAAKTYADGLNTAMDARMVAVEAWQTNFIEVSEQEINNLFA